MPQHTPSANTAAPASTPDQFGACPYVTAQQLLAGKWAIVIMKELRGGPRRFGELQRAVGSTQATLSNQLKTLEREGLVSRTAFAEVPPRVVYELTDIGHEFGPVLDALHDWGEKYIAYMHATHR